MKPRLLDLFCGAGGCTRGYQLAGFHVTGVDLHPQPNYCGDEFHQADALTFPLDGFDAIHASPPCQAFTSMKSMHNAGEHADLLTPTRGRLIAWGGPFVIENVPGAPMINHITICGSSLGLGVVKYDRELRRHRHFETTFSVLVPPCAHRKATIGIYGDHARDRRRKPGVRDRGVDFPDAEKIELAREAMGIDWMNWKELSQAIPPAYTELIGQQLMRHIELKAAA